MVSCCRLLTSALAMSSASVCVCMRVCPGLGPPGTKLSRRRDLADKGLCGEGCAAGPQVGHAETALTFVGQKRVDAAGGHERLACEARRVQSIRSAHRGQGTDFCRVVSRCPQAQGAPQKMPMPGFGPFTSGGGRCSMAWNCRSILLWLPMV